MSRQMKFQVWWCAFFEAKYVQTDEVSNLAECMRVGLLRGPKT